MNDTYIPDEAYHRLADALDSLDTDPAHPEPLRDRIMATLGEVGCVWPVSAETPSNV